MDLSHTGHRTSLDIMGLGLGPCMFSHANPRAIHHDLRNATDEQIDACVATGGVVCVNGVGRFLTDPKGGTAAILDCVDYLADRVGVASIGLGVDYSYPLEGLDDDPPGLERAYWWPPEHGYGGGITGIRIAAPEQLPEITDGLLRRGYAEADVRAVLGLNMLALARRVWGPAVRRPRRVSGRHARTTCPGSRRSSGGTTSRACSAPGARTRTPRTSATRRCAT
jgi:membrane dipeptidase